MMMMFRVASGSFVKINFQTLAYFAVHSFVHFDIPSQESTAS